MKQSSVFIDESGDFSFGEKTSGYHLITLVFHDQDEDEDDDDDTLILTIRGYT